MAPRASAPRSRDPIRIGLVPRRERRVAPWAKGGEPPWILGTRRALVVPRLNVPQSVVPPYIVPQQFIPQYGIPQ